MMRMILRAELPPPEDCGGGLNWLGALIGVLRCYAGGSAILPPRYFASALRQKASCSATDVILPLSEPLAAAGAAAGASAAGAAAAGSSAAGGDSWTG